MPTATDKPEAAASAPRPRPADRSAARQWGVLGLLIAVLIASAGYLGWHYTHDDPAPLGDDRDAVMAAADKFVGTVNTYGPDLLGKDGKKMPQYRSAVGKLLTPKFETDFLKNVPYAEATVALKGVGRSCDIYATGVSALDDDTATALVSGGLTITAPKSKKSDKRDVIGRQQFRVEVELVKQHGSWLVDNWTPAEAAPASRSGAGMAQ